MMVVSYLTKIHRFDLADRKLEKLRRTLQDTVAFQLVEAEVALMKGGKNIKDALYIFQELTGSKGRTKKLLAAQTLALLLLERLEEAESLILETLQMARKILDFILINYLFILR